MVSKKTPRARTQRAKQKSKFCFVLMPFKEPFDSYYERIYAPAIRAAGLEPRRIDEVFRAGTIIKDIWDYTMGAEVLVAELTGRNPNVFYELGLAHATAKPVVLVTQSLEDVPFDLKHLRHIVYGTIDPDWSRKLQNGLTKAIKETLNDPAASLALPSVVPAQGAERSGEAEPEVITLLKALDSKIDYMRREAYTIPRTLPPFVEALRRLSPANRYRIQDALERGEISPNDLWRVGLLRHQGSLFEDDLPLFVDVEPRRPKSTKAGESKEEKTRSGEKK